MFDSGPVISLSLNNMLWILRKLKRRFEGEFLITPAIKGELVDAPLASRKFKFEAHQVARLIKEGMFVIQDKKEIVQLAEKLSSIANSCFLAHNHPIQIVHEGEMEAIACAIVEDSEAIVVDERTTRYLIEEPKSLHKLLIKKLHTNVIMDKDNIKELKRAIGKINIIRSIELVTVAYNFGLFNEFEMDIKYGKKELLDSLLWGIKLHGCAVREEEILAIEKKLL